MLNAALALSLLLAQGASGSALLCVGETPLVVGQSSAACRPLLQPEEQTRNEGRAIFALVGEGGISIGDHQTVPTKFDGRPVDSGAHWRLTAGQPGRSTPTSCDLVIARQAQLGTTSDATWKISIDGDRLKKPLELFVPSAEYRLTLECGKGWSSEPVVLDSSKAKRGEVVPVKVSLSAWPVISGKVLAPSEVAAAVVLTDNQGRYLGHPEPDGSFRITVAPEVWPAEILISAAGYGPVTRPLPKTPIDVTVPEAELSLAGHVTFSIASDVVKNIAHLELFKLKNGGNGGAENRIKYRFLEPPEALATTGTWETDVEPGTYLAVFVGSEPLEKWGAAIDVTSGETRAIAVSISPEELEVRTFVGETRLPDAQIFLHSWKGLWQSTIRTDETGAARFILWQPGNLAFSLTSSGMSAFNGEAKFVSPHVDIRVPDRTLEGEVVDAQNDKPLPGLKVMLRTERGSGSTVETDDLGHFRFTGVEAGVHELSTGGMEGYAHRAVKLQVHEDVNVRKTRIALERQAVYEVEVLSGGRPAIGASVFEVAGSSLVRIQETNEAGIARMPASGAPRSVIVVSSDGRVFAQTLPASEERQAARIVLPPPTASIAILLKSGDAPIPSVSLTMRMNGVMFPIEVMQHLVNRAGIVLTSDALGRIRLSGVAPGLYEFWPVRSRSDVEAIMLGQMPAAPVVIAAGPGESTATLEFASTAKP